MVYGILFDYCVRPRSGDVNALAISLCGRATASSPIILLAEVEKLRALEYRSHPYFFICFIPAIDCLDDASDAVMPKTAD
jgi:hypothetical protein